LPAIDLGVGLGGGHVAFVYADGGTRLAVVDRG
jgi:hypothetical protein